MQRSRESMGYVEREPAQRYAFGNCGAALGRKVRYVDWIRTQASTALPQVTYDP